MGREKETKALTRKAYVRRRRDTQLCARTMARMAADADIRRECKAIGREFADAERDGLENRDSG